jgi:uncharacterized protein YjbJ (UPF0337 family)
MNWEQVEGKWDQFKGSVKEKWGKLTDDDLTMIKGRRENLAGRLKGKGQNDFRYSTRSCSSSWSSGGRGRN